jgi:AAA+ superfamily predicted ATPase
MFEDYSKHLVQDLVSSPRVAEFRGDFIAKKGNNTLILLYGDPGTGKTLTAESVAEVAEKPLLSLTYGELGTDPVRFKRDLEQTLYFSILWDCIILLNSVDAYFRRQPLRDECCNRSLTVVSETPEHYECTVILTSSRVDIFDQGFKSHIDLAVKYRKPDIINGR